MEHITSTILNDLRVRHIRVMIVGLILCLLPFASTIKLENRVGVFESSEFFL